MKYSCNAARTTSMLITLAFRGKAWVDQPAGHEPWEGQQWVVVLRWGHLAGAGTVDLWYLRRGLYRYRFGLDFLAPRHNRHPIATTRAGMGKAQCTTFMFQVYRPFTSSNGTNTVTRNLNEGPCSGMVGVVHRSLPSHALTRVGQCIGDWQRREKLLVNL